jgi:hypothetical protein
MISYTLKPKKHNARSITPHLFIRHRPMPISINRIPTTIKGTTVLTISTLASTETRNPTSQTGRITPNRKAPIQRHKQMKVIGLDLTFLDCGILVCSPALASRIIFFRPHYATLSLLQDLRKSLSGLFVNILHRMILALPFHSRVARPLTIDSAKYFTYHTSNVLACEPNAFSLSSSSSLTPFTAVAWLL